MLCGRPRPSGLCLALPTPPQPRHMRALNRVISDPLLAVSSLQNLDQLQTTPTTSQQDRPGLSASHPTPTRTDLQTVQSSTTTGRQRISKATTQHPVWKISIPSKGPNACPSLPKVSLPETAWVARPPAPLHSLTSASSASSTPSFRQQQDSFLLLLFAMWVIRETHLHFRVVTPQPTGCPAPSFAE